MLRFLRWLAHEAWEKINVVAMWRELRELGRKHGLRFFVAALVWEIIEDVVFPVLAYKAGHPELIPFFLVMHFEPVVYPVFFWGFRMWDRMQGREPWEPDRSAMSTYWRSGAKVVMYHTAVSGWFWFLLDTLDISLWVLTIYTIIMMVFGYIHERIWHDINWGILPDDNVQMRRTWAKSITYRSVSVLVMAPVLHGTLGYVPWDIIALYQVIAFVIYLTLETAWSKSKWGIAPVARLSRPAGVVEGT